MTAHLRICSDVKDDPEAISAPSEWGISKSVQGIDECVQILSHVSPYHHRAIVKLPVADARMMKLGVLEPLRWRLLRQRRFLKTFRPCRLWNPRTATTHRVHGA
jgi:hypothetical protein